MISVLLRSFLSFRTCLLHLRIAVGSVEHSKALYLSLSVVSSSSRLLYFFPSVCVDTRQAQDCSSSSLRLQKKNIRRSDRFLFLPSGANITCYVHDACTKEGCVYTCNGYIDVRMYIHIHHTSCVYLDVSAYVPVCVRLRFAFQALGAISCILLVDSWGRRPLLHLGTSVAALGYFCLMVSFFFCPSPVRSSELLLSPLLWRRNVKRKRRRRLASCACVGSVKCGRVCVACVGVPGL